MKNIILYPLFLGLIAIILSNCELINPVEQIPAYIEIESIDLQTNSNTQGSNSAKITEATVFAGPDLIGVFPLPARVPILASGSTEINIDAGIRDNGISASPVIYPYYDRYTTTVDLVEGEIVSIQPTVTYLDNLSFLLLEDFEDGHFINDDRDANTNTQIVLSEVDAFEGQSGVIHLDTDNPIVEVATSISFEDIPTTGAVAIYLELNYKTNIPFGIGVIGLDISGLEEVYYSHGLNTIDSWNKVYINLTEVISNSRLESYQIGFAAQLPDGTSTGTIQLDNVKLLHFNL